MAQDQAAPAFDATLGSSAGARRTRRCDSDLTKKTSSSSTGRPWARQTPSAWCAPPVGSDSPLPDGTLGRLKAELRRQRIRRQTRVGVAMGAGGATLQRMKEPRSFVEHREESSCMAWTRLIVQSDYFDYFVSVLLFVSSITIGWSVDYEAKHLHSDEHPAFRVSELFFCICFSIELGLRILVSGSAFFKAGPDIYWNVFDTFLVACQVAEETLSTILPHQVGPQVAEAVRVVRVIRIARVVRMLRLVRFVNELRKLVYLIIASFWSFIWTMVLLFMVTYIVAVFMTSNITFYQESLPVEDPELAVFFGTVSNSVHSLYQAVGGGIDWGDISNVLISKVSAELAFVFLVYVSFAVLVLLNLATGVFVDGAMKLSRADKEMELVKKVQKAFNFADDDGKGVITLAEFKRAFEDQDQAVVDIFRAIEIKVDRAEDLFLCLDDDGSGEITAQEFIVGALNLQGPAKALDLAMITQQQRSVSQEILELLGRVLRELPAVDAATRQPAGRSESIF